MEARYHILITQEALAERLPAATLDRILAANLAQDRLIYQLGHTAHFHFDDNQLQAGLAYVESQHQVISRAPGTEHAWSAFGRLSHAVQDFYAHTNYVSLWLAKTADLQHNSPAQIEPLDPEILSHPQLHSGYFRAIPDLLYYTPWLGDWLRRVYLPPDSHESVNLDSPTKGSHFWYAMQAAVKRTRFEYQRAAPFLQ